MSQLSSAEHLAEFGYWHCPKCGIAGTHSWSECAKHGAMTFGIFNMETKPKLVDRIIAILKECGPMNTYDLARLLWNPDDPATERAWRSASHGGPPGWVRTLGGAIARSERSGTAEYLETHVEGFRRSVKIGRRKKFDPKPAKKRST